MQSVHASTRRRARRGGRRCAGRPRRKPCRRPVGRNDWQALRALLPYLWAHKGRVIFALACLVAAKLATVSVPILLKDLVDRLSPTQQAATGVLLVPVALVVAYGLLRLSTSLFTELREFFFVNVTQAAMRTLALKTFRHLHSLSLRYHLERRTGAVTREIDQGIRGISSLISFTLYSILPTLIEITLVVAYLIWNYEVWFAAIVGVSLFIYIGFTVTVTNWRTTVRRRWNELESKAQSRAVDSLLNFETVKYFGNEDYEARRYDETLADSQRTAVLSQQSLNVLNAGQQAIIAIALTLILWRAALGVVEGRMTIGDLVLVNAFMIQLYIPLNFLGVIYREIKQSLTDMDRMFALLEQHREIADAPGAVPLAVGGAEIRFEGVDFALRRAPPGPARRQLRGARRQHDRGGRRHGIRQVDARAAAVPLLRRGRRPRADRRPGHARGDAGEPARGDRHRSAGHGAVQRHHRATTSPTAARARRTTRSMAAARAAHIHDFVDVAAGRLRHAGRRARAQALRRREAAGGDRPRRC